MCGTEQVMAHYSVLCRNIDRNGQENVSNKRREKYIFSGRYCSLSLFRETFEEPAYAVKW
jgi:hypothetical protein